ncbi:MAG: hypothetical protein ACTJIB_10600 [Pseudoalteromonas prydzensis]|uniref:hypothetical protein n=1 Tax=Pseudoalteromonas prydzensis TaxID=182141 RepID=UPI003F98C2AC
MTIDELIVSLTNDVESDNFILQVVFDRHINEIEKLKSQGITYKRIMELLNKEVSKEFKKANFNTLIFRAKQKIKTTQPVEPKTEIRQVLQNENPKTEVEIKASNFDSEGLKQSLKEWRLETNIDISLRQATRLEKAGINIEKLCELNFTTPKQVSSYLTKIEHRKSKD